MNRAGLAAVALVAGAGYFETAQSLQGGAAAAPAVEPPPSAVQS